MLESKAYEIGKKTISAKKDKGGNRCIHEYRLRLLRTLFISCISDIIIRTNNKKEYNNRCSKIQCKPQKFTTYSSHFAEKITFSNYSTPHFYKSKKNKSEYTVHDSVFCFFLDFFISSWKDESKKSPSKHNNSNSEYEHFKKTNNHRNKSSCSCKTTCIPKVSDKISSYCSRGFVWWWS